MISKCRQVKDSTTPVFSWSDKSRHGKEYATAGTEKPPDIEALLAVPDLGTPLERIGALQKNWESE